MDTSHDPDPVDGCKETVQAYDRERREQGMDADPLLYGLASADRPVQDPRDYFLILLKVRLGEVRNEWKGVVLKLQKDVRTFEQVKSLLFLQFLNLMEG